MTVTLIRNSGMHRLLNFQFIRYLFVGVFNTGFSYAIYATFLFIGLEYRLANLLALLLGIGFSFITQGKVVFKNATRLTFFKFVVAWLLIYLFNISLIAVLMKGAMSAYLAGALTLLPVTLISYFILKLWVFASQKPVSHNNQGKLP
jgi:putative flippase GtrA